MVLLDMFSLLEPFKVASRGLRTTQLGARRELQARNTVENGKEIGTKKIVDRGLGTSL